jgi:hypothetical protein
MNILSILLSPGLGCHTDGDQKQSVKTRWPQHSALWHSSLVPQHEDSFSSVVRRALSKALETIAS